jgi:hypothetical protein
LYLLTADRAATTASENELRPVMNAQLETVLRRYLVRVPEGQDVSLETELPALGLDSMRALTFLQFHCGWWCQARHALSEARREVKSPRPSPLLSTDQAASDGERLENRTKIVLAQVDGSMNQGG